MISSINLNFIYLIILILLALTVMLIINKKILKNKKVDNNDKNSKKSFRLYLAIESIIMIVLLIFLYSNSRVISSSKSYGSSIGKDYSIFYFNNNISFYKSNILLQVDRKKLYSSVNEYAWKRDNYSNDVCANINDTSVSCSLNDEFIAIELLYSDDFTELYLNSDGNIIWDFDRDIKKIIAPIEFNFFYEDESVVFKIETETNDYFIAKNTSCYEECTPYGLYLYNSESKSFYDIYDTYGSKEIYERVTNFYIKDNILYYYYYDDLYQFNDGKITKI